MGTKLYVGNLPFSVDDQSLQDAFAQAGQVASARIITDRESGRSKGFGFVEMATDDGAKKAIAELNGSEWEGRAMTVAEARPQEPRENRGDRGGYGR